MSRYVSQTLNEEHNLEDFICGNAPLDDWLKKHARRAHSAGTARTHVWTEVGQSDVLAYFSIAPTQVLASELTHALAGGYSIVPAYLLARLALDQGLQGQGLGGELLIDALSRIVDASASGGGRLIVVDAIDEGAIAFYQHHDFIAIGDSRRLYIKIVTAERIISPSK